MSVLVIEHCFVNALRFMYITVGESVERFDEKIRQYVQKLKNSNLSLWPSYS